MISEEARAKMRTLASRYPSARSATLPALRVAQEEEGYVTPEGIEAVADALGLKPDEVASVVSFYSMFHRQPVGRHVVKVCTSVSCYLRGCDALLERLEAGLGIHRGETTPDGAVTLLGVECLASCGTAPVLQLDDEFVENVTDARADALIAELRGAPDAAEPDAAEPNAAKADAAGPRRAPRQEGTPV